MHNILIIDDEPNITDVLHTALSNNYNVTCFNDSLKGLDEYINNPIYSVILVDYYMPNLKGNELIDKVLKINPKQKIIAIIGSIRRSFLEMICKFTETVQVLEKPFTIKELETALELAFKYP
ncbi:MAG: hypothetical protein COA79_26435 [Planctomycetota bacterium]|nr:MAG: hypothetical protein COA79_26435 [Planctomycetota bacterium]